MQFGYAVNAVTADNGQIGHIDIPIGNDSHLGNPLPVAGIAQPEPAAETLVDFMNDFKDARQQGLENSHRPFLHGLRQYGVVGI